MNNTSKPNSSAPPWLAPVAIVIVILALIGIGRKHNEALENPLVDLALITIGVCAFSAVFRYVANRMGSPGMAAFFGQAPSASTAITK